RYGRCALLVVIIPVVPAVVAVMTPVHVHALYKERRRPVEPRPGAIETVWPADDHDAADVRTRRGEADCDADAGLWASRPRRECESESNCHDHVFHRSPPAGTPWKGRAMEGNGPPTT